VEQLAKDEKLLVYSCTSPSVGIVAVAREVTAASEYFFVEDIKMSDTDDLAVLVLRDATKRARRYWKHASLRRTPVPPGTSVYTWGFPSDKAQLKEGEPFTSPVLAAGHVSALAKSVAGLDMHIHQGNSGGPLFVLGEPNVVARIVVTKTTPWVFWANDKEFERMLQELEIAADPTISFQIGVNMNFNGLLLRFLRKWQEVHSSAGTAVLSTQVVSYLTQLTYGEPKMHDEL
jgi:hypothetical protein